MGRVHFAWDPMLRRLVAVKLLHGDDPEQHLRLLREARNQAKLDHPCICRIHDLGMEAGRPYIAMQLVRGCSLSELRPELDFRGIASLVTEVAGAVHSAHLAGVIHRDLKPANILVTGGGPADRTPFVVDFGLARDLQAGDQTLSWAVMGTPAFMSPEQARGEELGPATDIYSLGATLYAMLSGHPPYEVTTLGGLITQQAEGGVRAVRRLNDEVPKDLETITLKCLEAEPSKRYPTAHALERDLRRWLAGEAIEARPVGPAGKLLRWAQRKPTLAATAAAGLLSVAVLGGWNLHTVRVSRTREQAAQRFGMEAERIEALVRYAHLLPEQDIEPHLVEARQRLADLEGEARRGGSLAQGPGAYAIGRSLLAFGEADQALPHLQKAQEMGMRSKDLSYALGRAYGRMYLQETERVRALPLPELREARRREIERAWRDPALVQLRQAKGLGLEPPEYLEALVDSYGGDTERALEKARIAGAKAPWFYEARRLEGELLLVQAADAAGASRAVPLLKEAAAVFATARRTAPSDPALWTGEARVRRDLLGRLPRDPESTLQLARCREAVQASRRICPSDPTPLLQVAGALMNLGQGGNPREVKPYRLFKESAALCDQVFRERPHSPEAHQVQLTALVRLALRGAEEGADLVGQWSRAVEAAKASLDRFPGDPVLLLDATRAAQGLATYAGYMGLDPGPAYELATAWAVDLQKRYPDLGSSHLRVSGLLTEQAEYHRRHGGDPRPFLLRAEPVLEAARTASRLPLDGLKYFQALGDLRLIQGQHALALGEDSTQALDQAIKAYGDATRCAPPGGRAEAWLAEAEIFRAMASFPASGEAERRLESAQRALDRALAEDDRYYPRRLLGQGAWLRGRLALLAGRDPSAQFRSSLRNLRRAANLDPSGDALTLMARVHFDQACSAFRKPQDIAEGLAAIEAALAKDRRSGEAHLLRGLLLNLNAEKVPPSSGRKIRQQAESEIQRALELNRNLRRRAEAPGRVS